MRPKEKAIALDRLSESEEGLLASNVLQPTGTTNPSSTTITTTTKEQNHNSNNNNIPSPPSLTTHVRNQIVTPGAFSMAPRQVTEGSVDDDSNEEQDVDNNENANHNNNHHINPNELLLEANLVIEETTAPRRNSAWKQLAVAEPMAGCCWWCSTRKWITVVVGLLLLVTVVGVVLGITQPWADDWFRHYELVVGGGNHSDVTAIVCDQLTVRIQCSDTGVLKITKEETSPCQVLSESEVECAVDDSNDAVFVQSIQFSCRQSVAQVRVLPATFGCPVATRLDAFCPTRTAIPCDSRVDQVGADGVCGSQSTDVLEITDSIDQSCAKLSTATVDQSSRTGPVLTVLTNGLDENEDSIEEDDD